MMLAALAIALAGFGYVKGVQHEEAKFDAYKSQQQTELLTATTKAFEKTKTLATANTKVTNDYLAEKSRRIASTQLASSRLQQLESALRPTDGSSAAPLGGANDPRDSIIDECATALTRLGAEADRLALKTSSLQQYTREVCLSAEVK